MLSKTNVDIIVKNCDLFTGNRSDPHYGVGAVAIRGNLIEAVGAEKNVIRDYTSSHVIDAAGAIVHPGLIDSHLHMTSALCHNLSMDVSGKDASLPSYAQIKCESDDETTAAFTAAIAIAKLRRGHTLFIESGTVFETDAFATALTQVGMRGMVSTPYGWDDLSLYLNYNSGTINRKLIERAPVDSKRVIDQCKLELKRNDDDDALVRGYVCLYGSGTATDELTQEAEALAKTSNSIFMQHQAFTAEGVNAENERFGQSGVARLEHLGALGTHTTLIHMNVLSEQDVEIVKSARPGLVWCPNMPFFYRVYPGHKCYHPAFYKDGLTVSLGVDTLVRNSMDTTGTVALLVASYMGEPLKQSDPFYMQSIDAATNLLLGDRIGSIAVGKRADLVIRSISDIMDVPLDNLGAIIAQNSAMIAVDTVIIDGKIVMQDGRATFVDQDKVFADAVQQRKRLFETAFGS